MPQRTKKDIIVIVMSGTHVMLLSDCTYVCQRMGQDLTSLFIIITSFKLKMVFQ